MFIIQAEKYHQEMSSNPDILPDAFESIIKNDLKIIYQTDNLYSFFIDYADFVAIGESDTEVDNKQIQYALGKHDPLSNLLYTDNSRIHSLVIINSSSGAITLAESIACSRPLYYKVEKDKIICSSHIKLMSKAGVKLNPNIESYPEICVYRYVLPPRTIYIGVNKVPGGNTVSLNLADTSRIKSVQQQFQTDSDILSAGESNLFGQIESRISANIDSLCSSCERPGILLSGGLDSSLLAAIARAGGHDVNSVSSSFKFINKNDREESYAGSVADHLRIDHKIYSSSESSYLCGLVDAIGTAEEPLHHLQSVMLYLLFRERTVHGNDMLLCGEGADGLFGNDLHLKYFKHQGLINFTRNTGIQSLFRLLLKRVFRENEQYKIFTYYFGANLENTDHLLWSIGQYGNINPVKNIYHIADLDLVASRIEIMKHYTGQGMLDRIMILSLFAETYETMTIWSKLAESHGIKMAYPFTSPDLLDLVSAIPWKIKLSENKYMIRKMLRRMNFPWELINRPKLSFGFPVKFWGVKGSLFQPIVDMASGLFDDNLLKRLQGDDPGRAMILWSLINIYIWHMLFIENTPAEDLKEEIQIRQHLLKNK